MKYNEIRRNCRAVQVGKTLIGGNAPIAIQSMTNTDTADVDATLEQVKRLEAAGCDIVRISVPTVESAVILKGPYERVDVEQRLVVLAAENVKIEFSFRRGSDKRVGVGLADVHVVAPGRVHENAPSL